MQRPVKEDCALMEQTEKTSHRGHVPYLNLPKRIEIRPSRLFISPDQMILPEGRESLLSPDPTRPLASVSSDGRGLLLRIIDPTPPAESRARVPSREHPQINQSIEMTGAGVEGAATKSNGKAKLVVAAPSLQPFLRRRT